MFNTLAYRSHDEIVFGRAKSILRYGFDLTIGNNEVVPEVKYWPYREHEKEDRVVREYVSLTKEILDRAVNLGISSLQLDTELSFFITLKPKLAEEIINKQKNILERYYKNYGIKLALRVTPADVRRLRGIEFDEAFNIMMETFEIVCKAGADVVSIESIGGKEVFDYALVRGDIEGIVFSLGILAPIDMNKLWREITSIARRNNVIPGSDTACGFANTAMILAGGKVKRCLSHVLAAIIRAMSTPRTLIAYENGALGPGKDCAYENVIIKAITGYPISMEGKTSAMAHSSLVGNIAAATCDLWSNEQVENIQLFSGSAPQVALEILYYDTKLMNTALKTGRERILRDLFIASDKFSDPQAFILSPDIAWSIAKSIIVHKEPYKRTIEAGLKALNSIKDAYERKKLKLDPPELRYLNMLIKGLMKIPNEEDELINKVINIYRAKVKGFVPSHYDL